MIIRIYTLLGMVLALSSNGLYADGMGTTWEPLPLCIPGSSVVPCEANAWEFGAAALYLQPSYGSKLVYLGVVNDTSIAEQITNNTMDWGWGYTIEGAYHFATGRDIHIAWYHFDQQMENSITVEALPMVTTDEVPYTIKPIWDAVNVELGQIINIGENKSLRWNGGVQFTHLANQATLSLPPFTFKKRTRFISANGDLHFNSIGPRLGLDFYTTASNGFGLYANAAITVLFGEGHFDQTSFIDHELFDERNSSRNLIIPEIEVKGGLQYYHLGRQNYISLTAGYMLVEFLSGIDSISTNGLGSLFSLNGPYLGVKWVRNP